MSEELCFASATELAARIRRRDLSPLEVVEAFLSRIKRRNDRINAYVTVLEEQAYEAAQEAEHALSSGQALGPLHGVPIAVKDLFDFKAGVRNTFGSKPFKDFVPKKSATYIDRLEKAGAIVLGKTNTPEFGIKGATDNLLFGPTSTPFALDKNAGGSSGGSAAAVADGLAAIAQGSDGGGSIRIPASFCGVYGLKPTFGRVAAAVRPDAFGNQPPLSHSGPLSRTVEDAALMLTSMAGVHARDPFSFPSSNIDYMAATRQPVQDLKIAYSANFDIFPVDERVEKVVRGAVVDLESTGARVVETRVGLKRSQQELSHTWLRELGVRLAVAATNFKNNGIDLLGEHRNDLTSDFADLLDSGQEIGAVEYKLYDLVRTEVFDALEDLFEEYDVLIIPTVSVPPFDNASDGDTVGPSEVGGEELNHLVGWCLTYPINFTGHPAASIPAGLTDDGLPVGMQIIGRRFAETTVLAASAAFERARPWHDNYSTLA